MPLFASLFCFGTFKISIGTLIQLKTIVIVISHSKATPFLKTILSLTTGDKSDESVARPAVHVSKHG